MEVSLFDKQIIWRKKLTFHKKFVVCWLIASDLVRQTLINVVHFRTNMYIAAGCGPMSKCPQIGEQLVSAPTCWGTE